MLGAHLHCSLLTTQTAHPPYLYYFITYPFSMTVTQNIHILKDIILVYRYNTCNHLSVLETSQNAITIISLVQ